MHSHELLPLLPFLSAEKHARTRAPTKSDLEGEGPRTFLLRGSELASLKRAIEEGDAVLAAGLAKLRDQADALMAARAPSVTHKKSAPEGAALNDYVSHAIYFWPNPKSADGLPYVRRDGEVNPEALDQNRFDAKRLERFANTLFVVSLAYYLSGDEIYAKRVALLLRTWFINAKTRQTPNFEFAQIVTGRRGGRSAGLIESRRYLYILDAEALIAGSSAWTAKDRQGLRAWFAAFNEWFKTSELGKDAVSKSNNIGLWCDLQLAIYALYLDDRAGAAAIVKASVEKRLPDQIAPDGSQPQEMQRARPYDYAAFNLLAMMGLARAGEAAGFDAWWAETQDGRSFARAMDWLQAAAKNQGGRANGAGQAEIDEMAASLESKGRALDQARTRAKDSETWAEELAARNREIAAQLQDAVRRADREDEARRARETELDRAERARAREAERADRAEAALAALRTELEAQQAAAGAAANAAKRTQIELDSAREELSIERNRAAALADARAAADVRALELAGERDEARARAETLTRALDSAQSEAARLAVERDEAKGALQRAADQSRLAAAEYAAELYAQRERAAAELAGANERADLLKEALLAAQSELAGRAAEGELSAQKAAFAEESLRASQAEALKMAAELEAATSRASLAEQALAAALEHMARRSHDIDQALARERRGAAEISTQLERSRRMMEVLRAVPQIFGKHADAIAAATARAETAEAARIAAEEEAAARAVEIEAVRTQTAQSSRRLAEIQAENARRAKAQEEASARAERAEKALRDVEGAAKARAAELAADRERLAAALRRADEAERRLSAERARFERELAAARHRVDKANRAINSLMSSTSWRITGPLRGAARLLRGEPQQAGSALLAPPASSTVSLAAPASQAGAQVDIPAPEPKPAINGAAKIIAKAPPKPNGAPPAAALKNGHAKPLTNGAALKNGAAKKTPPPSIAPPPEAAGCLPDYIQSLRGSIDALEKTALRHRSLPARDLLARIATAGVYSYDQIEAILESDGTLKARLTEIGPSRIHRRALAALARVVGNQGVTPHDELRAVWLYQTYVAMFGGEKLRPIDHILFVDLLTREGRLAEARAALDAADLRDADSKEYACLAANILHPGAGAQPQEAQAWLAALNPVLTGGGLEPVLLAGGEGSIMSRLVCRAEPAEQGPLVSVLMTTFNAGATAGMAIRSVLEQTWRNLELIIVDDCSGEEAFAAIKAWESRDDRVRVLRMEKNQGTYAAKNAGLDLARGEFVTCHDSDDWSHPRKVERQVKALLHHKQVIGNMTSWIRATDEMELQRFSGTGRIVYYNTSSLMFRRTPVMERCGYWDNVRTGADSEFYRRIEVAFGHDLPVYSDVLSFGQVREGALTHTTLGNGYESPDRKAYRAAWRHWHQRASAKGDVERLRRDTGRRRFAAPRVILPDRPATEERRDFDVIIGSDFRMSGGNTTSCLEEIKANARAGLTTAICQINSYRRDVVGKDFLDSRVLDLLHAGGVELVNLEDDVRCRLLLLRYPPILQFIAGLKSGVKAEHVRIICNQPPAEKDGSDRRYDIGACSRNAAHLFGKQPIWAPIGELARESIQGGVARSLLTPRDWHNVIDVDEWRCERPRFAASKPVIGRHSRDDHTKWPEDADTLRAVYPTDGAVHVRVLGGAASVQKLLGVEEIPNWKVFPFDDMAPRDFLKTIDYFVYFHHTQRVEAFGRTIIEAMASGCVTILPRHFEPIFKDGALYCEPHEVQALVGALYADRPRHLAQARRGEMFVRDNFGYEVHEKRVREIIGTEQRAK